jgi:hypothetical protein
MKNYIGIIRDHSASMAPHRHLAAKDYNMVIQGIKDGARDNHINTVVSVIQCGVGHEAKVEREIVLSTLNALNPIRDYEYRVDGRRTPLWDSVGDAIDLYAGVPDANDPNVTFLIEVGTDGQENNSYIWSARRLRDKIRELQGTDRWSFVFRVPDGYAADLVDLLGIPRGNILEWEQTEKGFERATQDTVSATASYFTNLRSGVTSTNRFYADLSNVKPATIKREMRDISSNVTVWTVPGPHSAVIKVFCEARSGHPYVKGRGYYQLVKTETVQSNKELAIRRINTGEVYIGIAARDILGIPHYENIRLSPGDHGNYELYVQSTSLNRVLAPGSKLLYITKPF